VVPQDAGGKLIASVLMIGGLSFFAVITGVITSSFVTAAAERRRTAAADPVAERLEQLSVEVAALRERLERDGRAPPGG
jgi:voltage-gated potassium channel